MQFDGQPRAGAIAVALAAGRVIPSLRLRVADAVPHDAAQIRKMTRARPRPARPDAEHH